MQTTSTISETYGEILPASVDKILSLIKPTDKDVFVDLGSGLGKVVIQVFKATSVKESRGIEVVPELHEKAESSAKSLYHLQSALFHSGRKLTLMLGDFLGSSLDDANIVLIGSPCFGPSILDVLAKRIDETENLHTVVSLRPLLKLKRLKFKKAFRVECSWDSAQCYWYEKLK